MDLLYQCNDLQQYNNGKGIMDTFQKYLKN